MPALAETLPQFVAYISAQRNLSDSTIKHHICNFKALLSFLDSGMQFNKENSVLFLSGLRSTHSAGSIANFIFTLRVICDFLIDRGFLDYNWARDIKIPKREVKLPVILTNNEIENILNTSLPSSYSKYNDPELAQRTFDAILNLLARTGSRIGEVLAIKIGDFDWDECVWRLNHTKTRRGRLIPIPPDIMPTLITLADGRDPAGLLFINPKSGLCMNQQAVGNNFKLRLKATGTKKAATLHTLRHSFITTLMQKDVSILKIANIVGHENIKTTQEYARLLYEDLRDAILMHPLTAKQRNPYDIIKQIKEDIKRYGLSEDGRFMYNIEEGNDGLRVSIFIR